MKSVIAICCFLLISYGNAGPYRRKADFRNFSSRIGESKDVFIAVNHNKKTGRAEKVCMIDGISYRDGDPVPTSNQCEFCICRPPGFACSLLQCAPPRNKACRTLQKSGACCPEYLCDCEKDGKIYKSGQKIIDPESPCDVCFCQGGDLLCSKIHCFIRNDCEGVNVPGRCCPSYDHCDVPQTGHTRPRPVNASAFVTHQSFFPTPTTRPLAVTSKEPSAQEVQKEETDNELDTNENASLTDAEADNEIAVESMPLKLEASNESGQSSGSDNAVEVGFQEDHQSSSNESTSSETIEGTEETKHEEINQATEGGLSTSGEGSEDHTAPPMSGDVFQQQEQADEEKVIEKDNEEASTDINSQTESLSSSQQLGGQLDYYSFDQSFGNYQEIGLSSISTSTPSEEISTESLENSGEKDLMAETTNEDAFSFTTEGMKAVGTVSDGNRVDEEMDSSKSDKTIEHSEVMNFNGDIIDENYKDSSSDPSASNLFNFIPENAEISVEGSGDSVPLHFLSNDVLGETETSAKIPLSTDAPENGATEFAPSTISIDATPGGSEVLWELTVDSDQTKDLSMLHSVSALDRDVDSNPLTDDTTSMPLVQAEGSGGEPQDSLYAVFSADADNDGLNAIEGSGYSDKAELLVPLIHSVTSENHFSNPESSNWIPETLNDEESQLEQGSGSGDRPIEIKLVNTPSLDKYFEVKFSEHASEEGSGVTEDALLINEILTTNEQLSDLLADGNANEGSGEVEGLAVKAEIDLAADLENDWQVTTFANIVKTIAHDEVSYESVMPAMPLDENVSKTNYEILSDSELLIKEDSTILESTTIGGSIEVGYTEDLDSSDSSAMPQGQLTETTDVVSSIDDNDGIVVEAHDIPGNQNPKPTDQFSVVIDNSETVEIELGVDATEIPVVHGSESTDESIAVIDHFEPVEIELGVDATETPVEHGSESTHESIAAIDHFEPVEIELGVDATETPVEHGSESTDESIAVIDHFEPVEIELGVDATEIPVDHNSGSTDMPNIEAVEIELGVEASEVPLSQSLEIVDEPSITTYRIEAVEIELSANASKNLLKQGSESTDGPNEIAANFGTNAPEALAQNEETTGVPSPIDYVKAVEVKVGADTTGEQIEEDSTTSYDVVTVTETLKVRQPEEEKIDVNQLMTKGLKIALSDQETESQTIASFDVGERHLATVVESPDSQSNANELDNTPEPTLPVKIKTKQSNVTANDLSSNNKLTKLANLPSAKQTIYSEEKSEPEATVRNSFVKKNNGDLPVMLDELNVLLNSFDNLPTAFEPFDRNAR